MSAFRAEVILEVAQTFSNRWGILQRVLRSRTKEGAKGRLGRHYREKIFSKIKIHFLQAEKAKAEDIIERVIKEDEELIEEFFNNPGQPLDGIREKLEKRIKDRNLSS